MPAAYIKQEKGLTIVEMMIATAVAGAVILISIFTVTSAARSARFNIVHSHYESRLQTALDDVAMYVLESRPSLVTFHPYVRDGRNQTALAFPTARNRQGNYVLMDAGGNVSATPLWQAMVVYAYADGMVRRYMDFSPRSYGSPISVVSVGETQMRLSDGTVFNLDGTPVNANQLIMPVLDNARRFEAVSAVPVQLRVEAGVVVDEVGEEVFIVTLDTGILARNHN